MAENQTAEVAEQDEAQQDEPQFQYPIRVEDAGPGSKKVTIEIPRARIDDKLKTSFKDLRKEANIPGFRPGHAPQKLIEKRFATDVRDQVRRELISESYEQAVTTNKLEVLGEPEFENPEAIKLPDEGDLSYTFSVEVQPQFTIPDLSTVKVKKPKIEIKEENIDQAMNNLREQQGALVPVEDRGVEPKDYLLADVHVKNNGEVIAHQHDAQIVARAGRVGGIQIDDLAEQLAGLKAGETRTIKATAAETHPNETIRGKEIELEIALKDLKRLELAEVTPEFLGDLGFETQDELRNALREQMVEKINADVQQALREQVNRHLLEHVQLELPAKLSEKQEARVINRRGIDLMMRGIPREQVEANIEALRGGAADEGARELKLFFILQKIATDLEVDVDEAELNGQIASVAAQRGLRPEKLKQTMAKDGSLQNLYVQLREQKAIDKVLESVQVEEVDLADLEKANAEASNAPAATAAPAGDQGEQLQST